MRAAVAVLVLGAAALPPSGAAAQGKKPKADKPAPLDGTTRDYAYDAKDIKRPERAYVGRAFVHAKASAEPDKPRPLLVFLHGLNTELIEHRWMGGGNEGDVRRIVAEMIERGDIPPVVVAGPGSIMPAAVTVAVTSWPGFDLDRFVARTTKELEGVAAIDPERVIVAGHSGAGCNDKGGLATAVQAQRKPYAALSIDTCMLPGNGAALARTPPGTHLIVSWQAQSWADRPFGGFRAAFAKGVAEAPPTAGVLRTLEEVRVKERMPHDAMVGITLRAWLPKLLGAP